MKKIHIIIITVILVAIMFVLSFFWNNQEAVEVVKKPLGATSSINTLSMVELINIERDKEGLEPLEYDFRLIDSAKEKACDFENRDYWSHVHKDGPTPWEVMRKYDYDYRFAGENLCMNFDDNACMKALMLSTKHRENILDKKFEDVGIGYCGIFLVQHFGLLQ